MSTEPRRSGKKGGGGVETSLPGGVHSLSDLKGYLGPVDEGLRREELDAVPVESLLQLGKRVVSGDIVAAVPAFCAGAWAGWSGLKGGERARLVGYSPALLPLLVDEALKLEALLQRYNAQDGAAALEVARRKRVLTETMTTGVALRDQCARALRRRVRGDGASVELLDRATGRADGPSGLASGLRLVAQTLRAHRAGGTRERLSALDEVGLTEGYAAALERHAQTVEEAERAAQAAVSGVVTQDALDHQDGRVLHLVDCVWRAFRDASAFVKALRAPPLGALDSVFTRGSRASVADQGEPEGDKKPLPG